MNLFSLMASLGLDTSEYQEALTDAQQRTEGLKGKLKEIGGSSETVTKGFGKIKTAVMVAGGAMATGLGIGVKYGVSLDNTMKKLQAQTGMTDGELKKVETSLRNIYKSGAGESIEEVGEAFAYATQVMGGTSENLEEVTQKAFTLSDTFGFDVNASIEAVNGMMNDFGITSEQAFNILAQGSQQGANAQGDLLETVREFGPAFQEWGFSAEEMMNVFITAGQDGAFQVNKVADAMNEFATRSIDGSKASAEAFAGLGIPLADVQNGLKAGGETAFNTFQMVIEKLANVDDAVEQEALGVALFGSMWEDMGGKAILSLGSMNDMTNGNIDTMGQLNVQYDTLGGFITTVKRSFEDWALTVVNSLLPPLRELKQWISENKELVNVLAGAIMGVVTAILIYKAVNFAMALGGMVKAMYTAIKTTGLLTTAQTALNGAMMLNPIGLIIGLIGGLIAIMIYLWNTNEGFRNFWIGAWNGIKEAFSNAWNLIKEGWNSMISWLQNLGNKIKEFAVNWFTYWNNMRIKVMEAIQGMIQWFIQLPQRLAENLRNCISNLIQWVIDMKNKGLEGARGLVTNVVNTIKELPGKALNIAKQIPQKIWEGITGGATWLRNKVSGFFSNIFSWFNAPVIEANPMGVINNNLGGASAFNVQGMNARALGGTDFRGYKQTTNVSLNIGGRNFDNLIIKTVANNYGKIESIVQSKERGRR